MHCKYGVLCIFKTSKFFLLWRKTLISIHISWPTTMVISSIFSFNWGHRESEAAECEHFLQKNGVKWHHQTMLFRQQMMHLPQKKKKRKIHWESSAHTLGLSDIKVALSPRWWKKSPLLLSLGWTRYCLIINLDLESSYPWILKSSE